MKVKSFNDLSLTDFAINLEITILQTIIECKDHEYIQRAHMCMFPCLFIVTLFY
jgi:hypothetical protein